MSADKYPSIFSRQMEPIVYMYEKQLDKIEKASLLTKELEASLSYFYDFYNIAIRFDIMLITLSLKQQH